MSYIKRKNQTLSLFNELKRRNALRVGAAYAVTAWLVIQVVATILPAFGYGDEAAGAFRSMLDLSPDFRGGSCGWARPC